MEPIKIAQTKKVTQRGQALTELAIFGSILLFCVATLIQYGLRANYQQQVQMEAFRKAQKIAFNRSGPNSATSLVLVKDKPIPDPRDQWGFAERDMVAAGANVTWDTDISARYVNEFPADTLTPKEKEELRADLPAVYFEIDKGNLGDLYAKTNTEQRASIPGENQVFGLYTARFEKMDCPGVITVVFNEDPSGGVSSKKYFEVKVKKEDIKVMRMESGEAKTDYALLMSPYFRKYTYNNDVYCPSCINENLMKHRISNVDLDGDGKVESVIAADNTKNSSDIVTINKLFYIRYHDNKTGTPNAPTPVAGAIAIDTYYTSNLPKPYGNLTQPGQRQGMIDESEKTIRHTGSKIEKEENINGKVGITSKTTLNATQKIIHKFRLNSGQIVSIPVEIPTDSSKTLYNWSK